MRIFAIHANNPIVPRSITNPVGGADRIKRTAGAVIDRLNVIEDWLIGRFEQIPVERFLVNSLYVNQYRYEYKISVTQLEMLVNDLLAELGLLPNDYVVREVVGAYEQGTGLAVDNLANISDDYTRTITQVLMSDPWQRRAALVGSRVFEEMKGFEGYTGRDLARVLRQAVQDGLNPRDVVGTIKERFGVSESRAKRIATTEISGALRRGRWDEAQDAESRLGIRVRMLWVSALRPTTRLWHASRHGLLYTIQEVREFYAESGNAINCYLPGTKVSGRFVAGSKAHYSGDTINIMTGGGRNITVTPNHPIMTSRGMVAAAEITESDYLVAYDGEVEYFAGVGNLNGDVVDSTVENVFCALSDIGHSVNRWVMAVDFHGDGRLMDKSVNIVNIDGILPCAYNSKIGKALDYLSLVKSDPSCLRGGSLYLGLGRIFSASHGAICAMGNSLAIFLGRFAVANIRRWASSSVVKSALVKVSVDGDSCDSVLSGKLKNAGTRKVLGMDGVNVHRGSFASIAHWTKANILKPLINRSGADANRVGNVGKALAGFATLDKVIKVDTIFYTGHVYDLQEVSGIMIANGIISSNCYCTQIETLVDKDGKPVVTRAIDRLLKQKAQYFGND